MKNKNVFISVLISIILSSLIIAILIIKNALFDIDYPNSWDNLKENKIQTRIDFHKWLDDNKKPNWKFYEPYDEKSSENVSVDFKNGKRCELFVVYRDDKIQSIVVIRSNIYFGFFNTAKVIYDNNRISSTIIN